MTKRPLVLINSNYQPGKWPKYDIPANYFHAVYEFGGLPLIAPARNDEKLLSEYAAIADGFLFTGGADYPPELYHEPYHPKTERMTMNRAETDLQLARFALESGKPILAICAGHQLMQISTGGTLIQHLDTEQVHTDEAYHPVILEENSLLFRLFERSQITVNSSHHQAVHPNTVSERFRIIAKAHDGTIEAMENSAGGQWILSLQWHPERITDADHRRRIFSEFMSQCRGRE